LSKPNDRQVTAKAAAKIAEQEAQAKEKGGEKMEIKNLLLTAMSGRRVDLNEDSDDDFDDDWSTDASAHVSGLKSVKSIPATAVPPVVAKKTPPVVPNAASKPATSNPTIIPAAKPNTNVVVPSKRTTALAPTPLTSSAATTTVKAPTNQLRNVVTQNATPLVVNNANTTTAADTSTDGVKANPWNVNLKSTSFTAKSKK
jgi:hypothetical protein